MSDLNTPDIEGAKSKEKIEEEKQTLETVNDQVIHMDLVVTQGVDVPHIQPDYDGVPAQPVLIEETKQNNDNTVACNMNATRPKAKRAIKKKETAAALTGTEGAQGTPIPDYWNQWMKQQQEQHAEMMDVLKGLRVIRGEAAPLQDAQLVPATEKTVIMEDPNVPESMIALATNAKPEIIIIPPDVQHPSSLKRKSEFEDEEESYSKRFRKALRKNFEYDNDQLRGRVANDPSMGQRRMDQSGVFYF